MYTVMTATRWVYNGATRETCRELRIRQKVGLSHKVVDRPSADIHSGLTFFKLYTKGQNWVKLVGVRKLQDSWHGVSSTSRATGSVRPPYM